MDVLATDAAAMQIPAQLIPAVHMDVLGIQKHLIAVTVRPALALAVALAVVLAVAPAQAPAVKHVAELAAVLAAVPHVKPATHSI